MIEPEDVVAPSDEVPTPVTAGALLRAARERQGMHIAVLAASIKVSPRKIDALERDRYEELPDATFVRALAQTVCRALKIDAQPVLALLPQAGKSGLAQVGGGLNAPFRERPGRADPGTPLPQRPLVWAGVALLVAAAAILLLPSSVWHLWSGDGDPPAAASAASALPSAPAPAASMSPTEPSMPATAPAAEPASAPAPTAQAASAAAAVPPPASAARSTQSGALVSTREASWIEAVDGKGQAMLSRIVQPGETVVLEGALPLRVKVGNARATQLVFRGQPVDLNASARDNVARVELK